MLFRSVGVMFIPCHRDERFDLGLLTRPQIGLAAITGIGQQVLDLAQPGRQLGQVFQHGHDLLFVVARLGDLGGYHQQAFGG